MKTIIKNKVIAIVAIAALVASITGVKTSKAAEEIPFDSYQVTRGIDSLVTTNYACMAGNNVEAGSNIIKLHLKEHDDTASTGNKIKAFSVFTDHPDWIRVVACDTGVDVNYGDVVDSTNYPSSRMHSGRSITVQNHSANFDVNGRQIYEGGAYVFLVANDYTGNSFNSEIDRKVSVTVVSRTSADTIINEDVTNLSIDIDAKEPEIVEPEEPEVPEEPVEETPAANPGSNNNNGINVNIDGNNNNVNINVNITNPQPEEKVEEPKEDEDQSEAAKDPEVDEEADEEEESEDDTVVYDLGDEIETETATYTVTEDEGSYEVEYTECEDDEAEEVVIPKTITIDGTQFAVTSIADGAFKGNKYIKSVKIGSNITEIGDKAFWGCKNLTLIKIYTKSLKTKNVGAAAFKKIKNVTIRCPKAKIKSYKKIFAKKGLTSKAKFKAL